MEPESIYWNPLIETLPPEKLRDLQFMKFKRTLDWVYQNSPFYKKIYKKAGYLNWYIGKPIQDNEQIKNTDFVIKHAPGHTSGNIALVSERYKTVIGGWWLEGISNFFIRLPMVT